MIFIRLLYGATLLAAPDRVLRAGGLTSDSHSRGFARLLGLRHVTEALVIDAAAERAGVTRLGAAVDAVHAATALVWAAFDTRHRRGLLANAAVAAGLATLRASVHN